MTHWEPPVGLAYPASRSQILEEFASRSAHHRAIERWESCYDVMLPLFSASFRPDGRPFLDHLVRTSGILLCEGAETDVVLAGLSHATYAQGDLGRRRRNGIERHRRIIRTTIGESAEEIVFEYPSHPLGRCLPDDIDGAGTNRKTLHAVALTRAANEVDEALDRGYLHVSRGDLGENLERLRRAMQIADRLGHDGLATTARVLLDDYEQHMARRGPRPEDGARRGSRTVLPNSARRKIHIDVRRVAGKLGEELRGSARSVSSRFAQRTR